MRSWRPQGPSWTPLGPLWSHFGPFWAPLVSFWTLFELLFRLLGSDFMIFGSNVSEIRRRPGNNAPKLPAPASSLPAPDSSKSLPAPSNASGGRKIVRSSFTLDNPAQKRMRRSRAASTIRRIRLGCQAFSDRIRSYPAPGRVPPIPSTGPRVTAALPNSSSDLPRTGSSDECTAENLSFSTHF